MTGDIVSAPEITEEMLDAYRQARWLSRLGDGTPPLILPTPAAADAAETTSEATSPGGGHDVPGDTDADSPGDGERA